MPRYLVEGDAGAQAPSSASDLAAAVERNLMASVTWICSYVAEQRTYALYEGPHAEAARRAARMSGLAVERISEVRTLEPYAYHGEVPPGGPPDRSGTG